MQEAPLATAGPPARSPGATAPSRVALWGGAIAWLALVAGAVATAGLVDRAVAAAACAVLLVIASLGPAMPERSRRSAAIAVAAAILVCVLQLVPLPEGMRAAIAPGPTGARSDLHALGLQGAWAPISVDVGATAGEALLWAGAAALLVAVARPQGPPVGARFAIVALVVLHGVAWIDWVARVRVFPLTYIEDPWNVGQDTLRFSDYAGWLINRNHWSALGLILWPLALRWCGRGESRARRVLGLVGALAVLASVAATRSRAGIVIAGAQVAALGVFLGVSMRGRARAIVLAASAAAVVAAALLLGRFTTRIAGQDVQDRADIYVATMKMAIESPWTGWGMGTFRAAFPAFQPDGLLYRYSHAHCDPLEWWAGGGVFGLVLIGGLAIATLRGARDRRASGAARMLWALAVIGGAAAACFEFPLQIPAVRLVWLGVLFAGPGSAAAPSRSESTRSGD